MYSKFLSILAIVLGTIGTIKAIFSVLKMNLQDVLYARSVIGQDTSELATLRQVYDARVGIGLVILSGLLQVFCALYGRITCRIFLVVSGIVVLSAVIYWIFMYIIYKDDEAELLDQMNEVLRDGYRDRIMTKKAYIKRKYMHKYKQLIKAIKGRAVFFNFENVNKCIDEIISNKSRDEEIKRVKALICLFEGKSNKSNVYTIFAICFALLIGGVSNSIVFNTYYALLLLAVCVILCIIAIGVLHRDEKASFVLKALNFKLEELNSQSVDDKEINQTDDE